MPMWSLQCVILLLFYSISSHSHLEVFAAAVAGDQGQNVALKKPVYANAKWRECLVDGNLNNVISPNTANVPMIVVNLEDVYRLDSIHLHAQNHNNFYNQGINESFSLYAWTNYTSPCDFEGLYPWNVVKKNLIFQKKGEEIVVQGPVEAQYLIILTDSEDPYALRKGLTIAELRAFGQKIRDGYRLKMPENGTYLPNIIMQTRQELLRGQKKIYAQVSYMLYQVNTKYNDVSLAWHYDRTNTMAAVRGKARMVFMSGPRVIRRLQTSPDYEPLRTNFRKWLNPQNPDAKFVNVSESYNDGDILLITRFDKFDVEQIYKRLTEGKNSAIVSYLSSKKPVDNRVAKLMRKLEVLYQHVPTSVGNIDQDVSEFYHSHKDVPWDYELRVALSSWQQFSTEKMIYHIPLEYKYTPEIQSLVRQVLEKYRDFFTYYAPCKNRQYVRDNKTVTALLNYNKVMLLQRGEKIMVAPGALRSPGYVQSTAKPVSYTVKFEPDNRNLFTPMGGYAKPGEAVRYKVLEHSERYVFAYKIQINPQTDDTSKKSTFNRWPYVFVKEELQNEGHIVSPFGGPIVISMPQNASLKIQFSNVYRYPWFDIRNPDSVKNWETEKKSHRGCPYGMISGDMMISMIDERYMQKMDTETIRWNTNFYDNIVKFMHNYRGTNYEEARTEVFVTDDDIIHGYGHAGYPWMCYRSCGQVYTDLEHNKKKGNHLYAHEIGHNLQVHKMTFKYGIEVTNNMYIPAVKKYLLGIDGYAKGQRPGWTMSDERKLIGTWKGGVYVGVQESYYNYFGRMFSPALVSNVLAIVTNTSLPLRTEEAKVNFWVKHMCQESRHDLIPFHRLWYLPISQETVEFCGQFPCVFPDDELTQQVPDQVNKILKDYGKSCSRSKPADVAFKNDPLRGIDKIRPQKIFFLQD